MKKKRKSRTITDQLKAAVAAEKSMYSLSANSGVSLPCISRFMLDERTITLKTAAKLCTALGLELSEK